jgi:hypothetical protein
VAGINRAIDITCQDYAFNKSYSLVGSKKPCIFLSHISVDKKSAEKIGEYIMEKADVDIYLDIYDDELQQAAYDGDSSKITEFIERGISKSTHTMCLISEETIKSWWVPYELGYAKKSGKKLSSLKLKGDVRLPEYLEIGDVLKGTNSLNTYIEKVISEWRLVKSNVYINESLESHNKSNHPLDDYLDWQN